METPVNETHVVGQEQPRSRRFMVAACATVFIGVAPAALAVWCFRAPAPSPPTVAESAPKTVEVIREKEVRTEPEAVVAPPGPPVETATVWSGVWRSEKYPLPMVHFSNSSEQVAGNFAPNWAGLYPFKGGKIEGDSVEFAVSDNIFRAHFRMKMIGTDMAEVWNWVTDEDWLVGFANANKMVRTPQQAIVARLALEDMGKRLGKPVSLGVFVHGQEMKGAKERTAAVGSVPDAPYIYTPAVAEFPQAAPVVPNQGMNPRPVMPRPIPHPGQNRPPSAGGAGGFPPPRKK